MGWHVYSRLQYLLVDLLGKVRAGLDHEADFLMDGGPPEMHCYTGNRSIHAVVAGQWGQEEGLPMEVRR